MDNMSFKVPLSRVLNCFSFNYLEYDTALPSIVEGRVCTLLLLSLFFYTYDIEIHHSKYTFKKKHIFIIISLDPPNPILQLYH